MNLDIIDKTSSFEAEDFVEIADNHPQHVNVYVFQNLIFEYKFRDIFYYGAWHTSQALKYESA